MAFVEVNGVLREPARELMARFFAMAIHEEAPTIVKCPASPRSFDGTFCTTLFRVAVSHGMRTQGCRQSSATLGFAA
jgi:hypothetical protein